MDESESARGVGRLEFGAPPPSAVEEYKRAVIESRVAYRRRLAQKIILVLLDKYGSDLDKQYPNVAQYTEDLANAISERLAAREDRELARQP